MLTLKDLTMIYRSQGAATVLEDVGRIDEKAKNFLEGGSNGRAE